MQASIEKKRKAVSLGEMGKKLYKDRALYLISLPFVIYFLLFVLRPMWGIQIAFRDYNVYEGIAASPWVGLKHFQNFLSGPYFVRNLRNTLIINLYGLIFVFPAPIVLAVLLNEIKNLRYKKTVQTITYLPHFISVVVVAGILTNLLSPSSGLINILLEKFGHERIYFLMQPQYFRAIYTLMDIWKETGFGAIVYVSAMASIDVSLYEACIMDGGKKWTQFVHITLPGILPTIVIMFIMRVGNMLNVGYEAILLLYQPTTYEVADVISTYVYRTGLTNGDYSLATAVNLFNSLIGILLVWLSNTVSKHAVGNGLW